MKKRQKTFLLSVLLTAGIILTGLPKNPISSAATQIQAATTQAPQETAAPSAASSPAVTTSPAATGTPDTTASPAATGTPDTTASPAATGTPDTTTSPAATSTPATTASPAGSGKNPFTGVVYTHNDSQSGKNIFLGIDVSYYQGNINWTKVKAAGVQFVILRLGYRGSSSAGTLNLDKKFQTYAKGATEVGLPIGVYFYTEAISEKEAEEEALFCIEHLKNYKITLPVAFDFEPATLKNGRQFKANLSKSQATNLCRAFCNTIKAAGYTPMVYSNPSDLKSRLNASALEKEYKMWLANYTKKTSYTGKYEFWQYSSEGKINGISGKVDCNFWYTNNTTPDATNRIDISIATVSSISKKIYNGKEKKPAVTISYKNGENALVLKEGTDYILSYANNIEIGTASITITGINDYTGTKMITFKIVSKYITNFRQINVDVQKTISLKWSKRSTATGYLLYRKATLNGTKYKKIATIETNKTTTFTDAKRAANRTFYYAIRAYTEVNGARYYSKYVYLDAATNPTVKTQQVKKATKLYESADLKNAGNKVLITIPKKASIIHLGKVYLTGTEYVYHVAYCVNETAHDGYIASSTAFM